MIGTRVGSSTRLIGSTIGSAGDDESVGGIPGVTRDPASQKYVPATAGEWATFIAATGLSTAAPSSLWLCQEAGSDLTDTIGGLTLTASATPAYQQNVPGWSRKAVVLTETVNQKFSSVAAGLPDLSTTSGLLLLYSSITSTPSGTRVVASMGTITTSAEARVTVTPAYRASMNAVAATSANTSTLNNTIPVVVQFNRTGSSNKVCTDIDKLVPAFQTGCTGKSLILGAAATSVPASYSYAAQWAGANAEMSDANIKAMLQALGWTITWT